jgi:hypothetical protein
MKYLTTLAMALLLLAGLAVAADAKDVTLSWDASPTASVTGYAVHYGKYSGDMEYEADAGDALTYTVADLPAGEWYFAVTAYNETSESGYSNIVDTLIAGITITEVAHDPVETPGEVTIRILVE